MAGLRHQHELARRQGIDQRRFPRAGAGRGIDHDRPLGPEHRLQILENAGGQPRELGTAVIDGRAVHGAQDPVRDVGGPGNLQEVAPAAAHRHAAFPAGARPDGPADALCMGGKPAQSKPWRDAVGRTCDTDHVGSSMALVPSVVAWTPSLRSRSGGLQREVEGEVLLEPFDRGQQHRCLDLSGRAAGRGGAQDRCRRAGGPRARASSACR